MSTVEELQSKFGVAGNVEIVAGTNGLARVDLHLGEAAAQVYLLGATVTSFKDTPTHEIIWLSKTAVFAPEKAIRGGVPLCWPQFGPGALVQHGFARTSIFSIAETGKTDNSVYNIANYFGYLLDLLTAFVVLRLTQNTKTLALWPHNFQLDLRVELMQHASKGPALRMELSATNNSTSAFSFTSALHSYYTTQHVFNAAVTPLQHLTYYDKTTQSEKLQDDALVKITAETDRVYYKSPDTVQISNTEDKTQPIVVIEKTGFQDIVVWNPGVEKQKSMADLSHWDCFICVEAGAIRTPITVEPGQTWTGSQTIHRVLTSSL